jgi:hypothetical protein
MLIVSVLKRSEAMSNRFEPQIQRIRDDVNNGNKLGEKSALRLLDIMSEMAQEIDRLQRRLDTK